MQDFFTIISNFGFPVAVASYLLFRFEKKLESLIEINRKLVEKNDSLVKINKALVKEVSGLRKEVIELRETVKGLKAL
jgi:hypothetical protein